jgi:hypothetical protein
MRSNAAKLVAVLAIVLLGSSMSRARMSDPFEGNWKITATPDGADGKAFDDVLNFNGGKLTSTQMQKNGFKTTAYDDDTRGRTTATFTAEAKSDKGGTMKWNGTITGPEIRGDLEWTKPDGKVIHYSYTGERSGK